MMAWMRRGVFVGLALMAATAAQAGMLVDVESGVTLIRGSWTNFGYSFTVTDMVAVTALGVWDRNANGFADAHPVGLWDGAGSLLAQAVVDSASPLTMGVLAGHGWRFETIAPVVIGPGTYKIGAYYPTTADAFLGSWDGTLAQYVMDPLASYGTAYFASGVEALTEPTSLTSLTPGFFGPNAQIEAVPEPGTVVLMGVGLVAVGVARRRRR